MSTFDALKSTVLQLMCTKVAKLSTFEAQFHN